MTTERLIPSQTISREVISQPEPELMNLTAQLGVPSERASEYVRSLIIALGQENQPMRAIDFLRFKLERVHGVELNGK